MTTSNGSCDRWLQVWREGLAPLLDSRGLIELRGALQRDAKELIQGERTVPPRCLKTLGMEVEAADPVAYVAWKGLQLTTVAMVMGAVGCLARVCECRMGEPEAINHVFNWIDETSRDEMIRTLLPEVLDELRRRGIEDVPTARREAAQERIARLLTGKKRRRTKR